MCACATKSHSHNRGGTQQAALFEHIAICMWGRCLSLSAIYNAKKTYRDAYMHTEMCMLNGALLKTRTVSIY